MSGAPVTFLLVGINALVFIAMNLLYGFTQDGVDNAAHLGGLAAGAAMGFAWLVPLSSQRPAQPPIRLLLLMTAAVAVLGSASLGLVRFRAVSPGERAQVLAEIEDARRSQVEIGNLEAAVHASPDSAGAYLQLSDAYARGGRPEDAVRTLDQAVARWPRDLDLLTALGSLHFNLRQLDQAVVQYQKVLQVDSTNSDGRYNLAVAYASRGAAAADSGHRQRAARDFESILQLHTDSAIMTEARQRLAALRADQPD